MITYKMHFIRTGATSDQTERQYVGQSNPPLCDHGIRVLHTLQDEGMYPQVEMVFTSPLQRCTETADLLYPNTFTEELDDLKDLNLGEFEGKTFEELRHTVNFSAWLDNSLENTPEGGEATADFTRRIIGAVHHIFARMMDEGMQNVAVVTHGGVIMTLLAAVGLPKEPMYRWAVGGGQGYTLLFTPQMWMRDGCAEVFAVIPQLALQDDEDDEDPFFH